MHENENNTHEDKDPAREINVTWRRRRQELDTNMESYIRGVTTLHHYEKISSRDLGLKELRVLRTEVILAFPGSFTVGMV